MSSSSKSSLLVWSGRLLLLLFVASGASLHLLGREQAFSILDALPPVCPLRMWTGMKCSFCGMTHAFVHLFFGEWQEAFRQNLLSLPLFSGMPVVSALAATGRLPIPSWNRARGLAWAGLAVLALYTVVRPLTENLTFYISF